MDRQLHLIRMNPPSPHLIHGRPRSHYLAFAAFKWALAPITSTSKYNRYLTLKVLPIALRVPSG